MGGKAVAVIGAGVSGIIAAKRLRAEGLSVRVFERALGPGGVWSYNSDAKALFATPMYDPLETNLPRDLMEFADQPWPEDTPLYPSHQQVLGYIRDYSEGVEVEYGTEVVDVCKRTPKWPQRWRVTIRKRDSEERISLDFDAVVSCIGTFDKPVMPEHDGRAEWEKAYPDTSLQNVLVVGVGPSGSDIAGKLSKVAKTLWQSTRGDIKRIRNPRIKPVGPIKKLNHKCGSVELQDGKVLTDVDKIIYCTGYHYSHSYLRRGVRAKEPLYSDGLRMDDLWEQMFWIEEPSLVFIGITKDSPTFLIAQAQAAYAARILAGISVIPLTRVMRNELRKDLAERVKLDLNVEEKAHNLRGEWSREYIDTLRGRCEKDAAAFNGHPITPGNEPFRWTKENRLGHEKPSSAEKKILHGESLSAPDLPHTRVSGIQTVPPVPREEVMRNVVALDCGGDMEEVLR
ncbi:Flavin-containing monooxygenase- localized to the cytoplasmic face of the ER membrane [Apiospora marii]|uniref:Flavin-containing monooxygenase- localized to the cytoplasmic face of the ER membrane n=1 Tax=Apiospora marii TaxID=335849 RepID=A0ABR1R5S7_9PEZI